MSSDGRLQRNFAQWSAVRCALKIGFVHLYVKTYLKTYLKTFVGPKHAKFGQISDDFNL